MHAEERDGWEMLIADLRRRTPEERLRAAASQRRISLELMRAGIRRREPALDAAGVERRLRESIFSTESARPAGCTPPAS